MYRVGLIALGIKPRNVSARNKLDGNQLLQLALLVTSALMFWNMRPSLMRLGMSNILLFLFVTGVHLTKARRSIDSIRKRE